MKDSIYGQLVGLQIGWGMETNKPTRGLKSLWAQYGLSALSVLLVFVYFSDGASAQEGVQLEWKAKQLSSNSQDVDWPAIVADQAGIVHIFWSSLEMDSHRGAIYYACNDRSDWLINDVIVDDARNVQAALDERDTLHLIWLSSNQLKYSASPISAANLTRGWSRPVTIADMPLYSPKLLADPKGILHVAFGSLTNTTSALYYLRSTDGGMTWKRPKIFEAPIASKMVSYPQLAFGQDGTLYLVWSLTPIPELYGGAGVYFSRSADSGLSWSDPLRLDETDGNAPGEGAWQASIAILGRNEVHVVWNAHRYGGNRRHRWSLDGGLNWSNVQPIWGSFASQTGPNPMIMDSSGSLYLFSAGTFDWSQRQGVYVSRWTESGWIQPELVNDYSDEPHWLHVALTEGNRLHVVWQAREQHPR
ncbi:MAG: sialidase family protein, partial [Chloroflexota bacterium]